MNIITENTIRDFKAHLIEDEKSAATAEKYLHIANHFKAFAGERPGPCQEKFAISGLRNMNQATFCSNAWTDMGFKYARETDQSSAYSMR
jgi:hypothetical protein